jgi:hypothetical protein
MNEPLQVFGLHTSIPHLQDGNSIGQNCGEVLATQPFGFVELLAASPVWRMAAMVVMIVMFRKAQT